MARFSLPVNQRLNPPWAAETLDYTKILPGGARLDNSAAILALMGAYQSGVPVGAGGQSSQRYRVQSGTIVARNIGTPAMNLGRGNPGLGSLPVVGTTTVPATNGVPFSQPPAPTALTGGTPLVKATTGTPPNPPNRDNVTTTTGNTVLTPGMFYPLIPALFNILAPTFLDPLAFELYLVAFDLPDISVNPDIELVRLNTLVYENMLPFVLFPTEFFGTGWTPANVISWLAHLRVRYQLIISRDPATP